MLAQVPRTRWGGIADGNFWPSGYFRVTKRNGIFWLIDPDGGRFLSKGVNSVRFDQDRIQNSDRIPLRASVPKEIWEPGHMARCCCPATWPLGV